LFDGKENFDLGEVAFSPMRIFEDLDVDLKEIEEKIKEIYVETEKRLGKKPNISDFPNGIHELLRRRRRIQNRMKNLQKSE
jgi:hypothetical protein